MLTTTEKLDIKESSKESSSQSAQAPLVVV